MDSIGVISKDTIPAITEITENGEVHELGELRDFRWSQHLRDFMAPVPDFSVSWVRLLHREILETHVHPIETMMVIYAGSGAMMGDLKRPVAEGDVIVVPTGRHHGFVGGPEGLHALSIQFGAGLYTVPEKPRVHFMRADDWDGLVAHSEERRAAFLRQPLFGLLARGASPGPAMRRAYRDSLRIWRDGVQHLRQALQAADGERGLTDMCAAGTPGPFVATGARPPRDTVMEMVLGWFADQMSALDAAGKIAVYHLVIEGAAASYEEHDAHGEREPSGNSPDDRGATARDLEVVARARAAREAFLCGQSATTFVELKKRVGEGWDMIDALTDRIADRVATERSAESPAPAHDDRPTATSALLSNGVGV